MFPGGDQGAACSGRRSWSGAPSSVYSCGHLLAGGRLGLPEAVLAEQVLEVDPHRLRHAADLINHRPRKALQFRTPHEVFSTACRAAGIPPPPARPTLCPV